MNGGGSAPVAGTTTIAGQGGVPGQAGAASSAGMSGTGTGGASGGGAGGSTSGGGGSTAAGSAGTGSGGNASDACAGALFCDDFEGYTDAPGTPWTIKKNAQGNVLIDGAQHRSGSKAVKFTTTGAMDYQQAYIMLDKIFPVANNAFFGRMMIYTTKAANDGVHWTMIQGEGPAAMNIARADVRYGGQHQQSFMANYDSSGPKSDCWRHSQTKMPEGKWACVEWYFDGATNTQKFWLDNTAIDDLTVVGQGDGCISQETGGKWLFPSFQHLYLGWESYQKDDPREVWIDDVAIGTTQVGCPK